MPNEPTVSVAAEMIESAIQPTLSLRDITQALRRDRGAHGRLVRRPPGRGACPPRGERGRQVDPDERRLGRRGARQRDDHPGRRAGRAPHAGDGAGPRDRDRPPASCAPARHDGRGEHPRGGRARASAAPRSRRPEGDARAARRRALRRATSRTASPRSASPAATCSSSPRRFAVSPRLLILDEPTAPLSQDSVELLFTAVRELAAAGTAIVYITHRLGEVREIADRVTVLRDGKFRGTSVVRRSRTRTCSR